MVSKDAVMVARCLALDALTVDALDALRDAGIDSLLLKGPATLHWLYSDRPGRRNYSDIDLLVPPDAWYAAVRCLVSAGLRDHMAGYRGSEVQRLYERSLRADSGLKVDLHRGFYAVVDRAQFWRELEADAVAITVAGRPVRIPGAVGAAVIYALHAAQNGGQPASSAKPLLDLRRAVERFDVDVWRAAAGLAERVGALDAFTIGLGLEVPNPVTLTGRVVPGRPRRDVVLRASRPMRRGDASFIEIVDAAGFRDRLHIVRDKLFPSATALRAAFPITNRGQLTATYVRRWASVPVVSLRYARSHPGYGTGADRRHDVLSGRDRSTPVAGRRWLRRRVLGAVTRPEPTKIATALWVVRALRATRRQLSTVQPAEIWLPVPYGCGTPVRMRGRADAVRHLLRLLHATCLEECIVRQRWLLRAGQRRDIVVGVRDSSDLFAAHAWIDGDTPPGEFVEITRYSA